MLHVPCYIWVPLRVHLNILTANFSLAGVVHSSCFRGRVSGLASSDIGGAGTTCHSLNLLCVCKWETFIVQSIIYKVSS